MCLIVKKKQHEHTLYHLFNFQLLLGQLKSMVIDILLLVHYDNNK